MAVQGPSVDRIQQWGGDASEFRRQHPWLLEDRLRLAGANYIAKATWTPHAVVDGNRITGQQSTSAGVTADAVLWKLKVIA